MAYSKNISPSAPGRENKTRLCSAAKPSVLFFELCHGYVISTMRTTGPSTVGEPLV